MDLFYDSRDDAFYEKRGSQILYWLDDLGARPVDEAEPDEKGFLFAGARPMEDYRRLVSKHAFLRDRPDERAPLLRLDTVLDTLQEAGARIPTPRTWTLPLDTALPNDLTFPLFVRTAETSWKLGGRISRVKNVHELEEEAAALRRAFGWDALILARQWLEFCAAGEGRHGPVPQEVRVWIVDGTPCAWCFHYLSILENPRGFPPSGQDLSALAALGAQVGSAFGSRLVAADFAKGEDGIWWFIEAGPGSCAGTEHEAVFKATARRLLGEASPAWSDEVGGLL